MSSSRRSKTPPRWLWAFLLIVAVAIAALRLGDISGDRGAANVFTLLLSTLGVVVCLTWFTARSGHTRALRLGALGAVIVSLAAFVGLFRFEGFSGSMVPMFGLRLAAAPAAEVAALTAAESGVNLHATTDRDFPGFLGPNRDLRVHGVSLARDWEAHPPQLLWSQPIGAGWSGFSVVNGFAATLEQRDDQELATLYDATTGELVWSHVLEERPFFHVLGGSGPRSTPTIDGGIIYVMSVYGHLVALEGSTGEPVWQVDLLERYGVSLEEESTLNPYGRPTSPLVHGDLVIVGVGGSQARRVSIAAFDKFTGELRWEGGEHQISMASPAIGTLAGIEQIVVLNENWASGHSLEDGRVLWELEWPGFSNADASVSQVVPVAPDRVFLSKGYGGGAALYQLKPRGDGTFEPQQLWHEARSLRTKLTNVAMRDGYVYGLSEGILECVNLDTGERAWKAGRYGHGQILLVDDVLLVLSEDGDLSLVEATPERANSVLGQITALEGHTWNNLALYGDVLLVRGSQLAAGWRLALAAGG